MGIFNKMVDSEQRTIRFQVDNLKLSHKDQALLDDFLDEVRSEFVQKY